MTEVELDDLVARYSSGPTLVRDAFAGQVEDALRAPNAEGWSLADVAIHLADAEVVRASRIRMILVAERAALSEFDEKEWRERLHYAARDPEVALAGYEATVAATADLIRALPDAGWARTGTHPTDGPLSVRMLVERGANHAAEHAAQIREWDPAH